ncbi:MAG: MarC family protein [Phycisphaeraceae bacterium]
MPALMQLFLYMLVIINPFAQVLYLSELMHRLSFREFAKVHIQASLLSFGVFAVFVLGGDFVLRDVFQVRLAALQIFGGMIILFIAYRYVTMGSGSNLLFRGDIRHFAPRISLPYMVGPGTIWAAILMGQQMRTYVALAAVTSVLLINMAFVLGVQAFMDRLATQKETIVGQYFAILMRTNALFIGAIGVEMIIGGLQTALTDTELSNMMEDVMPDDAQ